MKPLARKVKGHIDKIKELKLEALAQESMEIWNLVQLEGISPANKQTLYCRIKRYLKTLTRRR